MRPALLSREHRFGAAVGAMMIVLVASPLAVAQALPKNFATYNTAKPVAPIEFDDAEVQTRSLADFKGRVVLLNLWATWCVPCRKEMPALDRLQASLGGPDFEVVPLSIDRGGIQTVRKFYDEIGIRSLAMYVDASGQAIRKLGAVGLPTTLLVDRGGREVGLIIGPSEWDSPEIAEFLKATISKPNEIAATAAQNAQIEGVPADSDRAGPLRRGFQWLRMFFSN